MLTPITNGAIAGTGTFNLKGNVIGAVVMSANGTNAGTILLREGSATGRVLFDVTNLYSLQFNIQVTSTTSKIHYAISGVGCKAMFYEYIP